jgi:hypothetical protein
LINPDKDNQRKTKYLKYSAHANFESAGPAAFLNE